MVQCVLLRNEVALSVDALLREPQFLFVPRLPQVTDLPPGGQVLALRFLHFVHPGKKSTVARPFALPPTHEVRGLDPKYRPEAVA